jgi:uncharacterized damage-inducible protein DinB
MRKRLTAEERPALIENIAQMPARLTAAVEGLTAPQLDARYRPGGWTVRQLTHHIGDSHMNAFIRMKFALTENRPAIKGYPEALWAEMVDAKTPPIEIALALLESLHVRWTLLMRSLSSEDWAREMVHSENGPMTLDETLCYYAWHSRHHVAHITTLREREGWR